MSSSTGGSASWYTLRSCSGASLPELLVSGVDSSAANEPGPPRGMSPVPRSLSSAGAGFWMCGTSCTSYPGTRTSSAGFGDRQGSRGGDWDGVAGAGVGGSAPGMALAERTDAVSVVERASWASRWRGLLVREFMSLGAFPILSVEVEWCVLSLLDLASALRSRPKKKCLKVCEDEVVVEDLSVRWPRRRMLRLWRWGILRGGRESAV